ncbi:MAG: 50S ribosomal protein L5 [Patescibacteria group bacterium]
MNLKQDYREEFGVTNKMAVPKVTKIVLNIGLKEAVHDKGVLEKAMEQLTIIAGQKPKVTRAKISIANFKVREGDVVGLAATLRGKRMNDFMTKLFTIVLPRVRDFQGVSATAFDGRNNYSLGLSEQIVFPEIDFAKIDRVRGLEITFVTTAKNAQETRKLLELLGMPFIKS